MTAVLLFVGRKEEKKGKEEEDKDKEEEEETALKTLFCLSPNILLAERVMYLVLPVI